MEIILGLFLISSPYLQQLSCAKNLMEIEDVLRAHKTKVSRDDFNQGIHILLTRIFGSRRVIDFSMGDKERFFELLKDLE